MAAYLGSNTFSNVYLGSTQVDSLWLGSTKFWPETPVSGSPFFIGGLSLTQGDLESRLTGETLIGYGTDGTNTWATSSTNYTINNSAFFNNINITSYIDNGACIIIQSGSFNRCTNLNNIVFPSVKNIPTQAFNDCDSLTNISSLNFPVVENISYRGFSFCNNLSSVDLPTVKTLETEAFRPVIPGPSLLSYLNFPGLSGSIGGTPADNNVFGFCAFNGTGFFPSYLSASNAGAPDGDIQYLLGRGWTINYV